MDSPLLADLNEEQRKAVTWTGGPLLVVAGAGTGKTRVVTHRIAWLIREQGCRPSSIMAVTFTNKAAAEMKKRVAELLGGPQPDLVIGTFHSVCARFLREHGSFIGLGRDFCILDDDDRKRLLKQVLAARNPTASGKDLEPDLKKLEGMLELFGREGFTVEEHKQVKLSPEAQKLVPVLEAYTNEKRANDYADFDDLLLLFVRLLRDHSRVRELLRERFRHVLVDEFQDTNRVQLEMVKLLAETGDGFFAVGDDDQSIYRWRGARVENILNLKNDFPELAVQSLERNYRSTQIILDAAYHAIKPNPHVVEKRLHTDLGPGEKITIFVCDTESDEARRVAELVNRHHRQGKRWSDMAVFFRTNAQSRPFEEVLRGHRIPHKVIGGFRFFDRGEVKDILAYARLAVNPRDNLSFLRIVNKPARGIGNKTVQDIVDLGGREQTDLLSASKIYVEENGGRGAGAIRAFLELMASLSARLAAVGEGKETLAAFFRHVIEDSGYAARLNDEGTLEAEGRLENLDQLLASVTEYQESAPGTSLTEYLNNVALFSAADESTDGDSLPLMTVHSAKGLEFDVVFLTGIEEGLFPHAWSMKEGGVDEERRLFHVAITRAKRHLYFSLARSRARWGTWTAGQPSSFLADMPAWLFNHVGRPLRRPLSHVVPMGDGRYLDRSGSQLPPDDDY